MSEMPNQSELFRKRNNKLNQRLDQLLQVFSTYAVPIFIALLSLLALFTWKTQFPVTEPQQLAIRFVSGSNSIAAPEQALVQLRNHPVSQFHDTQLSQDPVWLSFSVPKALEQTPTIVEFPSRHTMDIACWDARTLNPLGSGNRQESTGGIFTVKAGFALELSSSSADSQVVCRAASVGPARLSALKWQAADLEVSAMAFHRKSGLLEGGILVLALFVLIMALINRNGLYILFAAWLVVNLRMGALSAGWDSQWLGNAVPQDWLMRLRSITTAVYYVLSISLFTALFRADLTKIRFLLPLQIAQWTCLPLLLLSALTTYQSYLPFLWVSTALSIGVMVFSLTRILMKIRSSVAIWYSAAIGVTLVSSLYEVLSAALGIKGLIGSVNSVTAAIFSSLLAALAIAEQLRQEHEQRMQVQAELKHTYEAIPIGLFTLDLHGHFLSANPALLEMVGPDALTDGANDWQRFFAEETWSQLYQMVHKKHVDEIEVNGNTTFGFTSSKRFLVKATLARERIEGSLQDITEKSRASADLNFLASHDSLTKVMNRRGIEIAFNGATKQLTDGNSGVAMAYLDLDRFKLLNDLFGHSVGDQVLQQVCTRVSNLLSSSHQFGRVGGDEFVIIFPKTPITLASVMCRGIIDCIGTEPYQVGDNAFNVRGSIGLIEISAGMQFNDAMSTSDRACRQAKAGNGDGLVVYERHALAFKQHEAELKLIALLATSSATDGLYLQMQPIMSLTAPHESLNFEVLLRMRDPDGQIVNTEHLIAAGEASGKMSMIDRWVLSTALAWLNNNYTQMERTNFVCMNLNGASLNDEKFLEWIFALLEQNMHIVDKLCLEITESVALHDLGNTRRFVEKVRGYGAKIALDDFGAGYTSFSYLREFKADLLKIDGKFIVDMNNHPANTAIVEAIVSLARNLGMKVIAEWAEDNATVQTLTEIGVDYVQGFAVARPQDPAKLLVAKSSASFIQDEALAQYVNQIGRSDQLRARTDLFSEVDVINVH